MKKIIFPFLFMFFMLICPTLSMASSEVLIQIGSKNAYVNGENKIIDVAPYIKNGRTMVPLRFISEAFGARVDYIDEDGIPGADIQYGSILIAVSVDSEVVWVDNLQKYLDVAPEIYNNRIFVPLRFFADTFKCQIDWDSENQIVKIVGTKKELLTPDEAIQIVKNKFSPHIEIVEKLGGSNIRNQRILKVSEGTYMGRPCYIVSVYGLYLDYRGEYETCLGAFYVDKNSGMILFESDI